MTVIVVYKNGVIDYVLGPFADDHVAADYIDHTLSLEGVEWEVAELQSPKVKGE